jgi:hypothetical protein
VLQILNNSDETMAIPDRYGGDQKERERESEERDVGRMK